MSNNSFPKSLNTETKQKKKVKQLTQSHFGVTTKTVRASAIQGCFSKTFEVMLVTGKEVIVQLRIEPLDMKPFIEAQKLLGPYVPDIEKIEDAELEGEDVWPFHLTRISGKTWLENSNRWDDDLHIKCATSLGKVLTKCFMPGESKTVVESDIIPKLKRILESKRPDVQAFFLKVNELLRDVAQLYRLPLFYTHLDLNSMNIMVRDDGEASGIIDWELAHGPWPFGILCSSIQYLAGFFTGGKFHERKAFDPMEMGFWKEIADGAPLEAKVAIESNWEAVQTSVTIGTILGAFEGEEGMVNSVICANLPKLLTYKIPALRGSALPYS
jgi:Phosphotransferase enzyme family